MVTLRLFTPATVALLLSLSRVSGTFTPGGVEVVPAKRATDRARGALRSRPRSAAERAADRVIARGVRGAIRADPFLAVVAPVVKVRSKRGVVRLVGRVRGDKEKSSIAFKAWRTVGVAGIDDRVTVERW